MHMNMSTYEYNTCHMLGEACGAEDLGADRANTVVPVKPAAQKRETFCTPFASVPTSRVAGRAGRRAPRPLRTVTRRAISPSRTAHAARPPLAWTALCNLHLRRAPHWRWLPGSQSCGQPGHKWRRQEG